MQQESRTAELNALWESLVQNPRIIHAFKTVGGDSREMQAAFPALPALHAFTNVVDVDVLSEGLGFTRRAGLSAYVELFDGRPLDKRMQCSQWARRPLTREQRVYAATDALRHKDGAAGDVQDAEGWKVGIEGKTELGVGGEKDGQSGHENPDEHRHRHYHQSADQADSGLVRFRFR